MEYLDDDEAELFEAFSLLRTRIVQVSGDFGARLGVRLRALSVARDNPDPSVLEVLGATAVDATDIMLSPLAGLGESEDDAQREDEGPTARDEDTEESDDE